MNDVGVIDTFLNTFTSYIDSGFGLRACLRRIPKVGFA